MPASPNDQDLKKQALLKMIGNSQPQMDVLLGKNQPKVDWKQVAENAGISGAPASQLGLSSLFAPSDAKYQGGGASERQMGMVSPATGQPALNRAGGPLDVSPAGVAGTAAELAANPNNYVAPGLSTGMGGVAAMDGAFPNLKKLMQPEEYMNMVKGDPNVQALMKQEALRGTVPSQEQAAANALDNNKAIIKMGKGTGEETQVIQPPEDLSNAGEYASDKENYEDDDENEE